LVTALTGGILVSLFSGSPLTIKGPAAGLVVIAAGAVQAFGGGMEGWKLALGAIAVAGVVQILFGFLKMGRLAAYFPLAAIRGKFTAIGIIIVLKQIPVLLHTEPALVQGKSLFSVMASLPSLFWHADSKAALTGLVCLFIMRTWPFVAFGLLKKIPAPLVVLAFAIPSGFLPGFQQTGSEDLIPEESLAGLLQIQIDFSGVNQPLIFVKYVLMFSLVGSLESLLTVRAADLRDPWKRKSDANRDLIATGIGNVVAPFFGGLPMISEVARTSAGISGGSRTRWANFFHGLFILLFLVAGSRILNRIPETALAAMLISVGLDLAHPRGFVRMYRTGADQLAVFAATIFFTLFTDLLVGIGAGTALKFLLNILRGAPPAYLFRPLVTITQDGNLVHAKIGKLAVFSNFPGIKTRLESIPEGREIEIDFSGTKLVDATALEGLQEFRNTYQQNGGKVLYTALDHDPDPRGHHGLTHTKVKP
jgi:MFS superfamily sulfate permease-like transporter